ncbi:unnamed protein product [Periconia digitata]|uniref:Rhodopsin domain-containing protein n=1 Tax=Periconia digitata TaxID=1303443 RepID=A0A9W4XLP8_9PLEO|nr:unnamed protein product [Periconia digitata]
MAEVPPPLPQPAGGDVDRVAPFLAIYWVEVFFAILIVCLRMWARHVIRNFGPDDWVMLFTLFMQIVLAGFVTRYALIGGTKHLYYLKPEEMTEILRWSYIFQCWGIMAVAPAKVSVGLLINRLIRPFYGWRYWVMWISLALMVILSVLDSIFTYVQCNPAEALWNKSITDAKCWDPSIQANISIAHGAYSVFCDGLLAFIPVTLLWKIQMPVKRRVGLSILLGLGLFAAVAGSIKTSKLAKLGARSDLTWEMYDLIIWAGTENFVVLFCGCIPPLKPLWDQLGGRGGSLLNSFHVSWRGTKITEDESLVSEQNHSLGALAGSKKSSMSVDNVYALPKRSV